MMVKQKSKRHQSDIDYEALVNDEHYDLAKRVAHLNRVIDEFYRDFPIMWKVARKVVLNVSVRALEREIGITRSYLSLVESGQKRPSERLIRKMLALLDKNK
jgi:hypothetical protein